MAADHELLEHKKWLGFLQPVGLVVSPIALAEAQVIVPRNLADLQAVLETVVRRDRLPGVSDDGTAWIEDLPAFVTGALGWERSDLIGVESLPDSLSVPLPEYGEVLKPTFGVPEPEKAGAWLMLIQAVPPGTDLDDPGPASAAKPHAGWHASAHAKFERLLRSVEVPIGLMCNGTSLRLVYAPRGETSGHLTFPVQAMTEVAGRLILGAMRELLSAERLFSSLKKDRRLPALLESSRKYQNEVSTRLAEQVMAALNELLRGFQAADASAQGSLLGTLPQDDPQHIYGGLLTTLMRMVFLLYAEDRGLMPSDPVYGQHYSVAGLFDKLREDAGRYPDTMDRRYGAWARLLSLFRLVYDGGHHEGLRLPPRHGRLFDPDAYPFLEGRSFGTNRVVGDRIEPPRVSDGVIHRVLTNLLVLDAERLSYRTLDVEQIGSVYEAMMGYDLSVATGPSIAVRPKHVMVDVGDLLERPAGDRANRLKETTDCKIEGAALTALRQATTPDEVVAALGRKVSPRTPTLLAPGSLFLQPGEERRRSGSHYTPRSLTEPIVRTTLRPILENLGARPTPEQILDLKVCDPAMGSGAFLVEACRQLADALVNAWDIHGCAPQELPPDEEPLLHARRLVAQRCLYGVDKNPFAVDLAKLSLWLVTLARDHAFTFLDHALKCGDSLVGLTRAQIAAVDWKVDGKTPRQLDWLDAQLEESLLKRMALHDLAEDDYAGRQARWRMSEEALADVRLVGDLCVGAFFAGDKDRTREEKRREILEKVRFWRGRTLERLVLEDLRDELLGGEQATLPFHWELEFTEVFLRQVSGFDVFVGNPPFAGKNTISGGSHDAYLEWLKALHLGSHGNADLVAHFFRRAFGLLRTNGSMGLLATKTIRQGQTRTSGLRWIVTHGGTIYAAVRRLRWPGRAAVMVSQIHIRNGRLKGPFLLDGDPVSAISSFLFHAGGNDEPQPLVANRKKSFQGSIPLGMGFTFDDADRKGIATPISEMRRLLSIDTSYREVIFPFIGYSEVASSPTQAPHRFVINFGDLSEEECWRRWPSLMKIVETKVRPEREKDVRTGIDRKRAEFWWKFGSPAKELYIAVAGLSRVLVNGSQAAARYALAFLPNGLTYSSNLNVFALESNAAFAVMQSRVHEEWARFFMSTMKDDLAYTPTTCFDPYPFLPDFQANRLLEKTGMAYHDFRAALMVGNNEGLTKTYNRFHDRDQDGTGVVGRSPSEVMADIQHLRELHEAMDRAVLNAYGWTDIPTQCEFFLDYEEDEPEDEEEGKRKRKKPWRLRWPDDVRDEVLARLLDLNAKRADEERLAAQKAAAKEPPKTKKGRQAKGKSREFSMDRDIFGEDEPS